MQYKCRKFHYKADRMEIYTYSGEVYVCVHVGFFPRPTHSIQVSVWIELWLHNWTWKCRQSLTNRRLFIVFPRSELIFQFHCRRRYIINSSWQRGGENVIGCKINESDWLAAKPQDKNIDNHRDSDNIQSYSVYVCVYRYINQTIETKHSYL